MKNHAMPVLVVLSLLLSAGCVRDRSPSRVPATLTDIENIDDLRFRFVADAGTPRVILLLSPT